MSTRHCKQAGSSGQRIFRYARLRGAVGAAKKDSNINMLNTLISSGVSNLTFWVRAALSISLFAFATATPAQNLVPNWSFEDTAYCDTPIYWPIQAAPPWFSANYATPDVFSMDLGSPCGVAMDTSEYLGEHCYQAPYEGYRFAGQYLWKDGGELKEYMQVRLIDPLLAGHSYRVSMRLSFPECYEYALDRFGAYFAADTVFDSTQPIPGALEVNPQVEFVEPMFFNNTTDWIQVVDTIVATGGESFMVIGSFTDNAGTNVQYMGENWPTNGGYYYFDAIEVVEIIAQSISEVILRVSSTGEGNLLVTWSGMERIDQVEVRDLLGRAIVTVRTNTPSHSCQVQVPEELATGTYVVVTSGGFQQASAKWTTVR